MTSLWQKYLAYQEDQASRYGAAADDEAAPFMPGWGRRTTCLSPLVPFVALDFETTGLSSRFHEIIEIGAIRVTPGETKTSSFHRLVQPSGPVPAQIVRLTGIDDALLEREGVDPCAALGELLDFVGDTPIVAYNASFDLGFLNAACERFAAATQDVEHSCVLALARQTWPTLRSHKLSHVAERLELAIPDAHRALGDAQRAANIYRAATIEHFGLHHLASEDSRRRLAAMHITGGS